MANENTKPLILAMNEAENELAACVNAILRKSQIPVYLFETIFDKIHRQIKDGARQELSRASAQYASESQPETSPENQDRAERTVQNGS